MKWIDYLLEANLYMVLFYAAYYLFLRRDTYYQLNRIYLIASTLVAFIIPIMQVGILKPKTVIAQITQVNIPFPRVEITAAATMPVTAPTPVINYYVLVYITCALIMTVAFCIRIYQLIKMARRGNKILDTDYRVIEIDDDDRAFSFFNYLFISKKLTASETIIQHELVHIRQKHSFDIMYFELVKIICWFNPVVYLMQNSIKEVHEFIADNHIAANQHDVNHYTDFLISNAYGLPEMAMANNFFNKNLLKNRIMMLHQKRSGSLARLKYLVALPLLAGMLCLSTLGFTKDYSLIDLAPARNVQQQNPPPPPPPAPPQANHKMPPPPPPAAPFKKPFGRLAGHIGSTVRYTKDALDKDITGVVALSFNLNTEGKIEDVKVAQSAGHGLDEAVIKSVLSYKNKILAKPGSYFIAVDFLILKKQKMPAVQSSIAKNKGFIGELIISDVPKVDQVRFPPPVVKPDGTTRKPKVDQVRFPPPVVVSDSEKVAFNQFYKELAKYIRYPTVAHDQMQHGKVFVIFNVDENNKPYNFFIARGLSAITNNEVIRVLASATLPANVRKDVNYTIPISFDIQDKNGKWADDKDYSYVEANPAVNKEHKQLGYKTNLALNEVVIAGYNSKK